MACHNGVKHNIIRNFVTAGFDHGNKICRGSNGKSKIGFFLCSRVGLRTISPSTRPTFTEEIGPSHGISETAIAAETPIAAVTSGEQSGSTDITVATTEQSFLKSLGKRGRIGLSMQRLVRIAFSPALPSRRRKEPGILPTAYIFLHNQRRGGRNQRPLWALQMLLPCKALPFRRSVQGKRHLQGLPFSCFKREFAACKFGFPFLKFLKT